MGDQERVKRRKLRVSTETVRGYGFAENIEELGTSRG